MGKRRAQTVTVAALRKALDRVIADGGGRMPVCVDKPTVTHPLESDGAVIIDIDGCRVESVPQLDDDGGMAVDSRGRERYRQCFVIHGTGYEAAREGRGT